MKRILALLLAICMICGAALAETVVEPDATETPVVEEPTPAPTEEPTAEPTTEPTEEPTAEPTAEPTEEPTEEPTTAPTEEPTAEPTAEPTEEPTEEPTAEPTEEPTAEPTAEPTEEPTAEPTAEPTEEPTSEPTAEPTEEPTAEPTTEPTEEPTEEPTAEPTEEPTAEPTTEPTEEPTAEPTTDPTEEPTEEPTTEPTADPTPEDISTPSPADGPLYVLVDGVKVYGKPEALIPMNLVIYLYSDAVVELKGYTADELSKVKFALDPEVFTEEDDCIYLSVRDPDGFVKQDTFFLWAGKKGDMATATPAPPAKDEVVEHEILVTALDYSASEPCRPTFLLAAAPALEKGMTFAVIVDGGAAQPLSGDRYTPQTSGAYRFALLAADGSVLHRSAKFTVMIPEPTATPEPTVEPTEEPTATPEPTAEPTEEPTATPEPTAEPTEEPTATPEPTAEPTEEPTAPPEPTVEPTEEPTATPEPTAEPTEEPTATPEPTAEPTAEPTEEPTATPEPTVEPTEEPTATPEPTAEPTEEPTATPEPTAEPTEEPTATPEPTAEPTEEPTATPEPTAEPTEEPTATPEPTAEPTEEPTATPEPTVEPTEEPTATPEPTAEPTAEPTPMPTDTPAGPGTNPSAQAWTLAGDARLYGSLAELLKSDGSVIYILTERIIVLDGGNAQLSGKTLLPDPEVFGDGYVVRVSGENEDVEREESLFVWIEEKGEVSQKVVTMQVEADGYVDAWSSVLPVFVLTADPPLEILGDGYDWAMSVKDGAPIILTDRAYPAIEEGDYWLRFVLLAPDGSTAAKSVEYHLRLDYTAPLLQVRTGNGTMQITVGDSLSGGSAVSLDGGATWNDLAIGDGGVATYSYTAEKTETFPAGMILVRDQAGCITSYSEEVTVRKVSNYRGGSNRTTSHATSTEESVTAYDGVELILEDGSMSQLTFGEETLDLLLTYTGEEPLPQDENGEEVQPAFTAMFSDLTEDGVQDTLVLTAVDVTDETAKDYTWSFTGLVCKKLSASGIDYLMLRAGDQLTVLTTAGFTAGLRYNMYRADGMVSKDFLYTLSMDAENGLALFVTVAEVVYPMVDDPTAEMYYYDLFSGSLEAFEETVRIIREEVIQ